MASAVVQQAQIVEKDNGFAISVELANITNASLKILPTKGKNADLARSPRQWYYRINLVGCLRSILYHEDSSSLLTDKA